MKNESMTRSTKPKARNSCRRSRDLKALTDALNIWAMNPTARLRTDTLRAALRAYQQAVKGGAYPHMVKKFCAPTAACNEVHAGAFEEFFVEPKQDANKLPWEE